MFVYTVVYAIGFLRPWQAVYQIRFRLFYNREIKGFAGMARIVFIGIMAGLRLNGR
jgi:hypothetical protein